MVYFARQLDVGLTEFSPREAERLVRELQKKDECLNELVPWFWGGGRSSSVWEVILKCSPELFGGDVFDTVLLIATLR